MRSRAGPTCPVIGDEGAEIGDKGAEIGDGAESSDKVSETGDKGAEIGDKGAETSDKGSETNTCPPFPSPGSSEGSSQPPFPQAGQPNSLSPSSQDAPLLPSSGHFQVPSHPFCIVEARAGGNIQFTLNIQEGESPLLTARGVLHPSTAFVPLGARAPRPPLEPHRSSPTCLTAGPCVQKDAVPKTSLKSPNPAPLRPPPALHPPRG